MIRTLVICPCFFWVFISLAFADSNSVVLRDGTPVFLELGQTISPEQVFEGEIVNFAVIRDVIVDNAVVIERGSSAQGMITMLKERDYMGQKAKLSFTMDSVSTLEGRVVNLRSTIHVKGKDRVAATAVASYTICPAFGAIKGGDVEISAGTEYKAYVSGNYKFTK